MASSARTGRHRTTLNICGRSYRRPYSTESGKSAVDVAPKSLLLMAYKVDYRGLACALAVGPSPNAAAPSRAVRGMHSRQRTELRALVGRYAELRSQFTSTRRTSCHNPCWL